MMFVDPNAAEEIKIAYMREITGCIAAELHTADHGEYNPQDYNHRIIASCIREELDSITQPGGAVDHLMAMTLEGVAQRIVSRYGMFDSDATDFLQACGFS